MSEHKDGVLCGWSFGTLVLAMVALSVANCCANVAIRIVYPDARRVYGDDIDRLQGQIAQLQRELEEVRGGK